MNRKLKAFIKESSRGTGPRVSHLNFIEKTKKTFKAKRRRPKVDISTFSIDQKKAFGIVNSHVSNPYGNEVLRLLITGSAGVGKTYLIFALANLLESHKKKYKLVSFTASSSQIFSGETIHSFLRLPMFHKSNNPSDSLTAAKKYLKGVSYIIMDEISMVGMSFLACMSYRMSSIFRDDDYFGGINVIAFGDHHQKAIIYFDSQLPPVADFSLYRNPDGLKAFELHGFDAYRSFDKAVTLETQMRQNSPDEENFRELLNRVRLGKVTQADISLLNSRLASKLPKAELKGFMKALVVFADNDMVEQYNEFRLRNLGNEIVEIPSIVPSTIRKEIAPKLRLSIGCRVVLTLNVWADAGLYNHASGTVTELIADRGGIIRTVMVLFDKGVYCGPRYLQRDDVPINRVKIPASDKISEASFTYENFPMQLFYGTTVYKIQGSTQDKLCIGLPTPGTGRSSLYYRLSPCIIFVALSRVRRLSDLLLTAPITFDLVNVSNRNNLEAREVEERRLKELEQEMDKQDIKRAESRWY